MSGVVKGRIVMESGGAVEEVAGVVKGAKGFIPKYKSKEEDVVSASRGMLAMVLNGEAISVLQRRIFDVGFEKLDIIPLVADKVLLRTDDDSDINIMFS